MIFFNQISYIILFPDAARFSGSFFIFTNLMLCDIIKLIEAERTN